MIGTMVEVWDPGQQSCMARGPVDGMDTQGNVLVWGSWWPRLWCRRAG